MLIPLPALFPTHQRIFLILDRLVKEEALRQYPQTSPRRIFYGHSAPRLSARTDTFRVRGYGEVTDADGNRHRQGDV